MIRRACCFGAASRMPQDEMAVAIVGTRHATRYGIAQAERLAASLARTGFTVVSGLRAGSMRRLIAVRWKRAGGRSRCWRVDY